MFINRHRLIVSMSRHIIILYSCTVIISISQVAAFHVGWWNLPVYCRVWTLYVARDSCLSLILFFFLCSSYCWLLLIWSTAFIDPELGVQFQKDWVLFCSVALSCEYSRLWVISPRGTGRALMFASLSI